MLTIFYALVLGFMMILDPCTLFTSVAAIGYIDRELQNKRRVLTCGLMFVLGKLAAYVLLSIPFIMGAQTEGIHHFLNEWGEPLLCIFMLVCGVLLLFTGHHHHDHELAVVVHARYLLCNRFLPASFGVFLYDDRPGGDRRPLYFRTLHAARAFRLSYGSADYDTGVDNILYRR